MDTVQLKAHVAILQENVSAMGNSSSHAAEEKLGKETAIIAVKVLGEMALDIKRSADALEQIAKLSVIVAKP